MTELRTGAGDVLRQVLIDGGLDWEEQVQGVFDVVLPGERKLTTPVRLEVGPHALSVHAFVCRKPDENHEAVYRWMLERNMKMFGMAFALDPLGDIFLDARLPLSVVTADEVDRLLGSVLTYADESFNVLLELGFSTAIRKEWDWRIANGESTANLQAFRGWLEAGQAAPSPEPS
ncbi:MAG: YbjN protein [Marmoricola sp.]|nr:YbjN protein [Marmoricola sp.]